MLVGGWMDGREVITAQSGGCRGASSPLLCNVWGHSESDIDSSTCGHIAVLISCISPLVLQWIYNSLQD